MESSNYGYKKRQPIKNDELSCLVLEAGLEPAQPLLAKGF